MAAEITSRKKRNAAETSSRTPDDDHRKRRRNRTTQSCLNCHTSKRMCDRKRPCGRCTQLGLTGLCVYEVDDPSQRSEDQDEKSRLQKRVAELEGVIREMKNKPHPRWVQSGSNPTEGSERWRFRSRSAEVSDKGSSVEESTSPSPSSETWSEGGDSGSFGDSITLAHPPSMTNHNSFRPSEHLDTTSASSSYISSLSSPLDTPSPMVSTPRDDVHTAALPGLSDDSNDVNLSSMFSQSYHQLGTVDDGAFGDLLDRMLREEVAKSSQPFELCTANNQPFDHCDGHCGCLSEPTTYNAVLELTFRLRKAADVLARSAKHRSGSACLLRQLITELDSYIATTLGSTPSPQEDAYRSASSPQGQQALSHTLANVLACRPTPSAPASTISPQSLQPYGPWPSPSQTVPVWHDSSSFMPWEAQR
ncbi:hypothetical protein JAAARDRAFT_207038 [Jaapia argillacea MUCL 33604]|uniref:Zn(2)-C6 fungal-type domain-containing protein n=1 Tax=Jaapia argillacea MUCL 33604 TaxID=933084 RepID=A0A067Q202_9AGAM|nr:hypothetical protein JAAARDRAFT_207038 [Jaapia argillacea MUCL 33604]